MVSAAQGYLQTHATRDGQIDRDASLKANVESISDYGLPMGWHIKAPRGLGEWIFFVLRSLFGWLITACAISLGAPFWFDMLNRFVVIRSTVKPHEKSQEEGSKN
jgi:hypothetical protein